MAQLVVAAAGAALGGFLAPGIVAFGMTGASIGWMAGSMLGSAFAPTQKSSGPQLSDLSVSTSAYGTPIPYVQGHPRIAGQIAWASTKREIATTEEVGKGGGGAEYTTYTYEVDLLILLTDNEIAGVRRVWSNGELIWTADASAGIASLRASGNAGKWARLTSYSGGASQLPDPTYEAAVGTANAPAYRGRGSVFIQSLQLGGSGQIPNLTFEVVESGGVGEVGFLYDAARDIPFALQGTASKSLNSKFGNGALNGFGTAGSTMVRTGTAISLNHLNVRGLPFTLEAWFKPVSVGQRLIIRVNATGADPLYGLGRYALSAASTGKVRFNLGSSPSSGYPGVDFYSTQDYVLNQWNHVAVQRTGAAQWVMYLNDGFTYHTSGLFDMAEGITIDEVKLTEGDVEFYVDQVRLSKTARYIDGYTAPTGPFPGTDEKTLLLLEFDDYPTINLSEPTIAASVSQLCLRTGLSASQFDTTALAAITRPVRSMAISSVSSARTVLDMLAQSYHFEAVLSDKIYFRPRATAPAATLTFNELGVVVDSGSTPEPLPLTQANELEIPAQMALTYSNVDGDYQTDTQYSDRLLTGQESTSAMTLPLGFTSSEAKQIVDAMLLDKAVSALTTSVSLSLTRAALEPTDVVLLTGEDGSTYRMRIVKKAEASGVTTLECVQDDSTVFTQTGTTSGGTASQTTVLATPTTTLELLDVPLLRDVDNLPGHYVAVKGSAANWTSAGLYGSLDDLTYTPNTTISSQAVIGTCTTTLADWAGGNVFDEVNSVTVNVGTQQLVSVTRDDILANQSTNAALIGAEVVQYRTATLVSAGVYTLSGFLRGQRGTDSTGHGASDRFIVLASGGLRFVPLQAGDLGRLRYYKAASAGQKLSAVTSQSLTPAGITLKPFAPVDARANRDAADTVLTWVRQTRLSTRIVGTLGISSPLGEAAEAYEVEIYTAGHAALLRTLTSATPSVTYTNAQQVADFGAGQSAIAVKIYQISATVGRGTPLTTTV